MRSTTTTTMRRQLRRSLPFAVILGAVVVAGGLGACGDDDGLSPSALPDAATSDITPNSNDGGGGVDATTTVDAVSDAGLVRAAFGLDVRPSKGTCVAPTRPPAPTAVALTRVYPNLDLTLGLTMMEMPHGDKQRWFGSQLSGKMVSFPSAGSIATATVVADVPALAGIPLGNQGESGLLGFTFHPKFQQNGRIYVSWNSADGPSNMRSRIGYLTSVDGGATFTSYTNVLVFDQPGVFFHHGGGIAFGADGYLYVSFGDGGDASRGANKGTFFSKVLRIDVDTVPVGQTYGIPADNPFAGADGGLGAPEPSTYAYGFRNPFRLSIDRVSGDVWVGDVGFGAYEEIDRLRRGGGYYGWDCREGLHANAFATDVASCQTVKRGELDPIIEIARDSNPHAIVGGRVYRGSQIPSLVGAYIFGDYSSEVHVARFDPTNGAVTVGSDIDDTMDAMGSFAEDLDGEIYAVHLTGSIYKVVESVPSDAGAPTTPPQRLSQTGCDPRAVGTGLIAYDVNARAWNNGAETARSFSIPDGATITLDGEGRFVLPIGSVVAQSLSRNGSMLETRLLVRHADGDWAGYSYEWLDDQSDAVLLPWSKKKSVAGGSVWSFPSRADCVHCHTSAGGRLLGLELGQLNGDFVYASTNRISNQLRTFEHIGLFGAALPPLSGVVAYPNPLIANTAVSLEARARAYLHTNCSMCHRAGSTSSKSDIDLRFSRTLAETKACGVEALSGDFSIANAKLLAPGFPARSHISFRGRATDAKQMPPLTLDVVDQSGMDVVDAWIASLTGCN